MKQIQATPKAMTTRVHTATAALMVKSRIFSLSVGRGPTLPGLTSVGNGVDDIISVGVVVD